MGQSQSSDMAAKAGGVAPLHARDLPALAVVTHLEYALMALHVYNEPDRRPLPPDWTVLMDCADVKLDKEGYFATAYVNDRLRKCVIAERGTADALGIRAGIWMYFDEPTIQFALAEQFSKLVRLRLQISREADDGEQPYIVSYTGHSLGGVIAACRACAEHTYAVTFEMPGCRKFVEQTMHPFSANDVDIVTYLRQPNPINSLRPHCGYLVQLPYTDAARDAQLDAAATDSAAQAKDKAKKDATASVARRALALPSFSLASPQEYLRSKLLERSIPELQTYLTKVEPVIRELLDRTQQFHSILGIVADLEASQKRGNANVGQDVVLVWPSHLMQFLEYFNTLREMEKPENQDANVYAAFQSLLQRLYLTEARPKHKMPLKFLNRDSQRLLAAFRLRHHPARAAEFSTAGLRDVDVRALESLTVDADNVVSAVLTGLEAKQYLADVAMRPRVRNMLDRSQFVRESKL